MPERDERLYRFDPLDGSGVFLGLGAIQCALLGGGLVLAVLALTAGIPLVLAATPALLGAGATFGRVSGYAIWEWLPLGMSWLSARLGRGQQWFPRLPLLAGDGSAAPPMPPALAGLDIVEVPWRGAVGMAAVRDRQGHTLTALLPASGPEFVTQPRSDQEQLLASWGDVLAHFASETSPVVHLGWSDLATQSGMREHLAWVNGVDRGQRSAEAAASYDELLAGAVAQASTHDVTIFVTVARDRLGRRAQVADPEAALARALAAAVEAVLRGLRTAGLTGRDPLPPPQVRQLLRARIDPFAGATRVSGGRLIDRLGMVGSAGAGPMSLLADWRQVRIDGAWHRTYWVVGYPRLPQHPSWLEPFLAGQGICRTVTVFFEPVSSYHSRRRIERDLVKLESDAQTREDKGRRVDARHRRATQTLLDREQELVAGYPEMGHTALVTVSAPTLDQLENDCEVVEQLGREVGIELRTVDGRQDLAWACSLPFGLAPRRGLV
ncbi:MAG: hypothetical protein M3P34_05650 [Actinomycetota bacterium]|nr:hypothetical protein [Actinomycetota bacterium]